LHVSLIIPLILFPAQLYSEPNVLDESQGLLEEGNLSRYSVTALCVQCLCAGAGPAFPVHHIQLEFSLGSFSLFLLILFKSLFLSLSLSWKGTMKPVYVLSLCGTHVISSEPHGVMVSTHVSGFLLLKLEFLFGGPICGACGVWSSRFQVDN